MLRTVGESISKMGIKIKGMKLVINIVVLLAISLFSCEVGQKAYNVNSTAEPIDSETEYPRGDTYFDTDKVCTGEGVQSQNGERDAYVDNDGGEIREVQTPKEKCNGIDDDGDGIIDEADDTIDLKRPCDFPASSCIGMADLKDIMWFEVPGHPPRFGPGYCSGITRILTKTYIYFISPEGLTQLPQYDPFIPDLTSIYFAKITSESTLKDLCEKYDLRNIDFSKEFIVVVAYYFQYSKYFDIGLVGGLKISGNSILVDIFFYRDLPVPIVPAVAKHMTWYGWDAFILPRKYLNFDIKFVSTWLKYEYVLRGVVAIWGDDFLKIFDYCPYSFEMTGAQNVQWRKVKASDLSGCYSAVDYFRSTSFPIFKVDVDYPNPIELNQEYADFITVDVLRCEGLKDGEYLIKPHAQFDYLNVIRKGKKIYILVEADEDGGDYLPVVNNLNIRFIWMRKPQGK